MATDGEEIRGSRGGSDKSLARKYRVNVTSSSTPEADVLDWIYSNAPATIAGLTLNGITLEEDPERLDEYTAEAQYGFLESTEPPASGTMEYRFNYQAQGGHFYQSLETIGEFVPSGKSIIPFNGAINVVKEAGKRRCEGYEVQPPAETFTLAYYPVNATVTPTYQNIIEELCGRVNDYEYRGKEAGTLMLVRCTGGVRTGEDWSIEFGFGYVPNQTDIPVGDEITVTAKDGLDLLWPYYGEKIEGDELVKQPRQANVERVWYRGDFSALALPS